ncbi:hypothetical protein Glove_180g25 [Diversispora epigaea]|uniref:Protein PNS1 n=1 Tax=Diversispora epigaea TaxID=1348612 RepID=A0A397IWW8_9GLOM|nr:hypothetical protein Glove_180g25 [Diversispora epigaea]
MFPSKSIYTKLDQDHSEHSDHSIDEDIISIGSVEEFLESIELQTSQFLKNKPEDENTSPKAQNASNPPTCTSPLNVPHVKSPSQASKYKIEVPIELNSPQPASIYLETPPPIPQQQVNNTLREGLLPNNPIPPPLSSGVKRRKFRDPGFAVLYIIGFLAMLAIGIELLCTTNSSILDHYTKDSIFFTIKESAGLIIFTIFFSTIAGILWIASLRLFVKVIIYGITIGVPLCCTTMFVWALNQSLTRESRDAQDYWLLGLSFIPLCISFFFVVLIYAQRDKIKKTIKIVSLACDIINDNPHTIIISLMLSAVQVIFSIVWLFLFCHVFLVGDVYQATWRFNADAYFWGLYLIFMWLWTSNIIRNIQKVMLAGVVSEWYFYRHEPNHGSPEEIAILSLKRAATNSFGTVCLGSLLESLIKILRFINNNILKKYLQDYNYTCFYFSLSYCLSCFDHVIENMNNYILIYAGIACESFWESALSTTKLFSRNLIFGLVNDLVTQLVVRIGSIVIGLLCGFASLIYASHSLNSPYGYVVGLITGIIPFRIVKFYADFIMDTIDASFICYAIDLDVNKIHSNEVHESFSNFQIQ